jgi:hypothetical protein
MLPSVAYQSPGFFPHQRLDHGLSFNATDQAHDLAHAALQAALRRPLDPQLSSSFQDLSRPRNHHAQPIQRPAAHALSAAGLSADPSRLENSLRRKTPNGTIAAGYDATPGDDTSIQPPATKHIIVSSLDTGSGRTGLHADILPQYNNNSAAPASLSQYQNFPPAFKYDTTNRTGFASSLAQSTPGGSWIRSLDYPGDPLPGQNPAQPQFQRHFWQNGPAVPTVIASSFHPGPGQAPGSGLGHEGYVPYYPAALRDSRYQSTPLIRPNLQEDPLSSFQTPFNRQSIPSSDHIPPGFSWNPIPAQSGQHAQLYNTDLSQRPFTARHVPPSGPPAPLWTQHPHQHLPTQRSQPSVDGFQTHDSTPLHGIQGPGPAMVSSQPRNAEFKEKILAWAHSIYVDLLAALHNARKKGYSQGSHDSQTRGVPSPSIYPKPPRQAASYFPSQSPAVDRPGHCRQLTLPFHPHSRSHSRQHDHSPGFHDQRPISSLHVPPYSSNLTQNGVDSRGHFAASFDRRAVNDSDRFRTIRRSSTGASSSRLFGPVHHGMSVTENATAALEILSSLCIESGWEWIDGILVGGCLAYGLGDYNKAMRWYSRIIQRDPTYVRPETVPFSFFLHRFPETLLIWRWRG